MNAQRIALTAAALFTSCQVLAAGPGGFAAVVSPPRFELSARSGATLRNVFELTNRSATSANFHLHTADFTLDKDYSVQFQDALQPGSCRPWVLLERPQVQLPGGATIRYRFEVRVPQDAAAGECRFGILIEGDESAAAQAGAVRLPIAGRIGIIVYVVLGDARPQIEVFGPQVVTLNGQKVPALRVHNSGNAHARLGGFLSGKDAHGVRYEFNPSTLPILPGEERQVLLMPSAAGNDHPTLSFPVTVQGNLEWGDQTTALNEHFE